MKEKVWNIRIFIQKLEDLKDDIINHLNSLKDLDDSTKRLWIADVKEFYYNTVSAWESLINSEKIENKNINDSKTFLYIARNCLSKIISELNIFKSERSSKIINKAEQTFKECWDAFWEIFNNFPINREIFLSTKSVVKISDYDYQLLCSVCGNVAVEFRIGYGRFDKKESLVFRGITHETSLDLNLAKILFRVLQEENLLEVHNFLKKYHTYEGLDAYCPECNKIYCWEHYNVREEYDDGFYDFSYGECPEGHKRMIDD